MKKLMSFMLAVIMLLTLAACGGNGGQTANATQEPTAIPTQENKIVELTPDNIEDYLAIKFSFTKPESIVVLGVNCGDKSEMTTSMYSTRAGSFDGVEIKMEITSNSYWKVSGETSWEIEFRLPANGEYEHIQDIYGSVLSSSPKEEIFSYRFISVTGSFIPIN